MLDKAILENGRTIESVLDFSKIKQICDKAIDNYPHTLKFVFGCCKTQKNVA